MQVDWLKTLIAVVDQGGFTAAAHVLHRSQSRVSDHVGSIERHLGATLLDRTQRPVALTEAGKVFLEHARAVVERLDVAESEVSAVDEVVHGSVTLGSYPSASAAFVPSVLKVLGQRYPDVAVSLIEYPPVQLEHALLDRDVDLALRPCCPPPTVAALHSRTLWRERLKVVVHLGHQLSEHPDPISLSELAGFTIITAGESSLRQPVLYDIDNALSENGLVAERAFPTSQPHTVMSLVRAGIGVGIINQLAIEVCGAQGLCVLGITDSEAVRDVGIFWNGRAHRRKAAKALFECMLDVDVPAGTTDLSSDTTAV